MIGFLPGASIQTSCWGYTEGKTNSAFSQVEGEFQKSFFC